MLANIGIPINTKIVLKDNTSECRICLENNGRKLIYPCKCKFPVHKKCLIKWLKSESNTTPNKCEICRNNYNSNYVIIINRNVENTIGSNILDYDRRREILIRRKKFVGKVMISLLSSDLFVIYYFYYNDDYFKEINILNIYYLLFINFIIFCFLGTIQSVTNNNYTTLH